MAAMACNGTGGKVGYTLVMVTEMSCHHNAKNKLHSCNDSNGK